MRCKLAHPWWGSNPRSLDYIPSSITRHVSDHQSKASQIYYYISGSPNKEIVYVKDKKYYLNMSDDGHFEFYDLWENGVIYSLTYGRNGFSAKFHIETINKVLFLKNAYRSLSRAIFQFFVLTINFTRCSIALYRLLIRLNLRSLISWCINLPKIRNHCDVTMPASGWSILPLSVDGVMVRARVKFGLVSSCVFYHNCFQTLLSNIDAVQNRQKRNHSQTTPSAPSHPLRHPRTGVGPTHLWLLVD